jgi:hypothetical protein
MATLWKGWEPIIRLKSLTKGCILIPLNPLGRNPRDLVSSYSGQVHLPLTQETGVQFPLGLRNTKQLGLGRLKQASKV